MTGRQVAHYETLELLGRGGMGEVYKARDTQNGGLVAIKFLSGGDSEEARERFQREARAASLLDHANICTILETGEYEGRPYYVMPLIEGLTLRQRISSHGFTYQELVELFSQLAAALEAAHNQGIIHRDIKPGNIMIDAEGNARILDFGLVKRVWKAPAGRPALEISTQWDRELTSAGIPLGTLEYMSPEQIRGEELDARTDLFNLGMVIYEVATRRHAFEGSTPGVIIEGILGRTPPSPSALNPSLPPAIDYIIQKLLEKDRELRYQTAMDLRADLKRLLRDEESGAGRVELEPSPAAAEKWPGRWIAQFSPLTRGSALALVALLMALAAGLYLRAPRASALSERDTIVLTDFANTTGDPVFEGTLKQALAVELWQSPYLNIFPDRRVREALVMMGRSPEDRVTREVAREICLREGAKALIASSISSLGQTFVITLEAVDSESGEILASEQAEAASKEQVLHSLGSAASRLRAKLGESLNSIERFNAPLDRATTPSLEALRAFSLGNAERGRGREFESIPFFKRAIELDPDFALAFARLGAVYSNLGETSLAMENSRKAYGWRGRVSERERYYITAHYHGTVTGDVEKSIENYELWKHAYPRDATPVTNLSAIFNDLGQFDRALRSAEAAAQMVNINRGITSVNIAAAHMGAGRFAEARPVLDGMMAKDPDSSSAPVLLFMIGCAQRDQALMQRQLAWADGRAGEVSIRQLQALALAASGELTKARETFQITVNLARRFKRQEMEAATHARRALVEALLGNDAQARANALEAVKLSRGKETLAIAAQSFARIREFDRAERLASDLERQFPEDSILNRTWLPAARATMDIERGRPDRAIEHLRAVKPYELGFLAGVAPTFLRGQAFLRAGDPARAAAEFERVIARPGVEAVSPIHSLAWLELARASKLAGNPARSRQAYQEFLNLWSRANPDLLLLKQARAEFERL